MLGYMVLDDKQEAILQLLKDSGDLIHYLQSRVDLVFDKQFPWGLVNKLGETGRKARHLLPAHDISDLTNDPEMSNSLKRAMGR